MNKVELTGTELAKDLAKTRDLNHWITWTQIPLGSVFMSNGRVPRADVLSVNKSYTNHTFIIYEVKVNRTDFLGDVNRGKYLSYFDFCDLLYFAAPSGLLRKEEIPEKCGLIVRGNNGWRVVKSATRRDFTPSVELLLKLLMRDYENRLETWRQYEKIKNLEYKGLKEASIKHGIKISRDLEHAAEMIQVTKEMREKIGEAMGKKYDTLWDAIYHLKSDVGQLLSQKKYAEEIMQLTDLTMRIFRGNLFVENVPAALRKVAKQIEEKHGELNE